MSECKAQMTLEGKGVHRTDVLLNYKISGMVLQE